MNPAILKRHRASGGKYINSDAHYQDIATTISVENLEKQGLPIKKNWGKLDSDLYSKLCGEQMRLRKELGTSRRGHELMEQFDSDPERDIYTLSDGDKG